MLRQQLQHLGETVGGANDVDDQHWEQHESCDEQQAMPGNTALVIQGHASRCGHYIDAQGALETASVDRLQPYDGQKI